MVEQAGHSRGSASFEIEVIAMLLLSQDTLQKGFFGPWSYMA